MHLCPVSRLRLRKRRESVWHFKRAVAAAVAEHELRKAAKQFGISHETVRKIAQRAAV